MSMVRMALLVLLACPFVLIVGLNFSQELPSPGLSAVAITVAVMGAIALLLGLMAGWRISRSAGRPMFRSGLDILAVLGGATFIVWLGNVLA